MPILELAKKKKLSISRVEEYYNALRTNIQLSGENIKVIAVSSTLPGEGKTTTSTNLALTFANAGYKTLLIDADIRNSKMLGGVFRSSEKITGLTEYLSGNTDLSQGLCETDEENLFVITSGQASPNPTALVQSEKFEVMMDVLRRHYDYIIVDTPPIGMVIDATLISKFCDASMLVVASNVVKRKMVQKSKTQLEQSSTPFLGVILNKYNVEADKYGFYGSYGNYGDRLREEEKKSEK
ncbi:Tyrosine-protein kinase CpsD [Streptococcus cristatus]|uniref:Tyrosine-protein kinase CpsD n=1 Tax=Streptococcus cristatus TaxID=45634 RepID=A0A3R9MQG0_STRCR|nr:tyrosine-protein kinase [Streptococcus cristatus]RSJ80896.1 Tyrosine-protein kinase CpsD [Streptococcus cristatus]RSJ82296.1 Tyrosine-protein kinase CpsD [Streptococcus cristatus]RSJ87571.1 Tyrosine-protein kinase CpsD [Streptococcus cristatus]RSJ88037.1 Tyrosine-protein kinase CpsD [Streptococcus cristatus]